VKVTVLFFAYLRDFTGTPQVELEVPEHATARQIWAVLNARWPALEDQLIRLPIVVDGTVVDLDTTVPPGAEVVWLPPVGGGAPDPAPDAGGPGVIRAELTAATLEPARLLAEVSAPGCGGIVVFVGEVRAEEAPGRSLVALEYEAYDGLAAEQLRAVAAEGAARWPMARIALAHRTGRLIVGEASVAIAVACPHRADAFACCRHLIDRLKEAVPIWKRQVDEGGGRWLTGQAYKPAAGRP